MSRGDVATARLRYKVNPDGSPFPLPLRTAAAIILMISHGYSVKEKDDPIVRLAELGGEQLSTVTEPGAFLVDLIPACESPEP